MKKIKKFFKRIPWYAYVVAALLLLLDFGCYKLSNVIAVATNTMAWSFSPKIAFDDMIPVIPFFGIIYILAYAVWAFSFVLIVLTKKENYLDAIIGFASSFIIAMIIFILAPAYLDREAEGVIELSERGGMYSILKFIMALDGNRYSYGLIPSLHCSISVYCFLVFHREEEIHLGPKIFLGLAAILICLSTLFTKQHYFLDTVTGISFALIIYLAIYFIKPGKRIIEHHNKKITHQEE